MVACRFADCKRVSAFQIPIRAASKNRFRHSQLSDLSRRFSKFVSFANAIPNTMSVLRHRKIAQERLSFC